MTCQDARDQFSARVDDALTPGERAALDAHLALCPDCRRELQRFRDTVALVRAVGPARAPVGFVDRVLEAARPVPWYRRLVRGLFLPWAVKLPMEAAAIVLVAVGVALVYRGAPELRQAAYVDQGVRETREMPREEPARAVAAGPPPQGEADARREAHGARESARAKDQLREFKEAPEPQKATPPPAAASPAVVAPGLALSRTGEPQQPAERREKQDVQATAKLEAPSAAAERERAQAPRDFQQSSSATTAPQASADLSGAKRAAPAGVGSVAFATPAVSGRLTVSDRDAALRAVAELATRLGAVETRRADIADGQLLELTVPREAYPELIRELARLGRWQPSTEPAELPAQVRVVLQITR